MMKTPKKIYALPKSFLQQFADKITALADMRRYTSWRIGGAADWLIEPETEADVLAVMDFCGQNKLPLMVIGRGTNLLVSDAGIAGLVMRIGEKFSAVEYLPDNRVWVSAGALLAAVSKETAAKSLTGLEWACGIPGNIGGALMMNAGAYGSCMADVVTEVRAAAYTGAEEKKAVLRTVGGDELCFGGYRSGCIAGDMVALSAVLQLAEGDAEKSLAQIRETIATRAKNQPLEYPSAGSVFRNPEGSHAGYLVEQTGCKGWQVGGAQVSEKHGNFIINIGDAKAGDVLMLIKRVQTHVLQQTGYALETEVRLLGRDSD
ncbi:MAG: UDP-N-acetylmuramate dehydrogenase [Firmicutes bacterium]|nr:UDP-N-acetylmuramate dehydrogenase [Bacillota bacterium]